MGKRHIVALLIGHVKSVFIFKEVKKFCICFVVVEVFKQGPFNDLTWRICPVTAVDNVK